MLNITNHQRNTNQNHSEVLPDTYQDSYYQKNKTASVGEDVEKLKPFHTIGGDMKCTAAMEKKYESSSKN